MEEGPEATLLISIRREENLVSRGRTHREESFQSKSAQQLGRKSSVSCPAQGQDYRRGGRGDDGKFNFNSIKEELQQKLRIIVGMKWMAEIHLFRAERAGPRAARPPSWKLKRQKPPGGARGWLHGPGGMNPAGQPAPLVVAGKRKERESRGGGGHATCAVCCGVQARPGWRAAVS